MRQVFISLMAALIALAASTPRAVAASDLVRRLEAKYGPLVFHWLTTPVKIDGLVIGCYRPQPNDASRIECREDGTTGPNFNILPVKNIYVGYFQDYDFLGKMYIYNVKLRGFYKNYLADDNSPECSSYLLAWSETKKYLPQIYYPNPPHSVVDTRVIPFPQGKCIITQYLGANYDFSNEMKLLIDADQDSYDRNYDVNVVELVIGDKVLMRGVYCLYGRGTRKPPSDCPIYNDIFNQLTALLRSASE